MFLFLFNTNTKKHYLLIVSYHSVDQYYYFSVPAITSSGFVQFVDPTERCIYIRFRRSKTLVSVDHYCVPAFVERCQYLRSKIIPNSYGSIKHECCQRSIRSTSNSSPTQPQQQPVVVCLCYDGDTGNVFTITTTTASGRRTTTLARLFRYK